MRRYKERNSIVYEMCDVPGIHYRLEDVKKKLHIRIGQKMKLYGENYKVKGLYPHFVITEHLRYGWTETFTYGELWQIYNLRMNNYRG